MIHPTLIPTLIDDYCVAIVSNRPTHHANHAHLRGITRNNGKLRGQSDPRNIDASRRRHQSQL
jgi:hypothetical protein